MDISSPTKKKSVKGIESEARTGYLTTTEFSRLCGVCRFTIINWAKQGKIKGVMKTAGGHLRIPAAEVSSLFKKLDEKSQAGVADMQTQCRGQQRKTGDKKDCSKPLPDDQKGKHAKAEKRKLLYNFGYGIGRGVQILKERK